jgi:hypothetical protein
MGVGNVGGHAVSDSLPGASDASLATSVNFPNPGGDTTPQTLIDLTNAPPLSGANV